MSAPVIEALVGDITHQQVDVIVNAVAVGAVREWLTDPGSVRLVRFVLFSDPDLAVYQPRLGGV